MKGITLEASDFRLPKEAMARGRAEQLQREVPEDTCDGRVEIKYYLRNACFILRKAEAYHRDGDAEWEYRCLWRFACLVADVLPHHPSYRRKNPRLTNDLRQHARLALDRIQTLEHQIESSSSTSLSASAEPPKNSASVPYDPYANDAGILQLAGIQQQQQQQYQEQHDAPPREHRLPDGRIDLLSSDLVGSKQTSAPGPSSTDLTESVQPDPERGDDGSTAQTARDDGSSAESELNSDYYRIDESIREKHSLGISFSKSSKQAQPHPQSQHLEHLQHAQAAEEGLQDGTPVYNAREVQQDNQQSGTPTPLPHRELDVPPQKVSLSQPSSTPADKSCECHMPSIGMNEKRALEQRLCSDSAGAKQQPQHEVQPKSLHLSTQLMDTFMRIAEKNTRRNLETCAILAGEMRKGVFFVTTLIVPKQTATSDSVTATNEEEIFDEQDNRQLFSLGWIHTHPQQACFLSSIDLHTHCAYQTMLEEAVAVVMAPTDKRQQYGIFQLTTPEGLKQIQQCTQSGFHPHTNPGKSKPIYEHSKHVFFNASVGCEVVDLR